MRVEISIDRTKKMPDGAIEALKKEFSKRLEKKFGDNVRLDIKRSTNDGLVVTGAKDVAKEDVANLLQETWESADDWFNA